LTRTRDIGHTNYLTALPQLEEHYNNTKHSRTSMKTIDLQEAEMNHELNMKLKEQIKNVHRIIAIEKTKLHYSF